MTQLVNDWESIIEYNKFKDSIQRLYDALQLDINTQNSLAMQIFKQEFKGMYKK